MKPLTGKLLYGLAFCGVLPALLTGWACALDRKFPTLPSVMDGATGPILLVVGGALMIRAMWELWSLGGGLPMNAYPPVRHVARGLYGWLPHPIYLGFGMLMPGVFVTAGMPAGVWIVSPVLWLGMISLVVGHERMEIRRLYGSGHPPPRLGLPPDATEPPRWWHRLAVHCLVLGPGWAGGVGLAGLLRESHGTASISPDRGDWRVFLLIGTGLWFGLAPFAATSQAVLRRFIRDGWVGSAAIFWCFLLQPRIVSLPSSVVVFWTLLAVPLWMGRLSFAPAYTLAMVLTVGGWAAGILPLASLVAGLGGFFAVSRLDEIWRALLRASEAVANSWRGWRIGRVRIINHGGYVALAAGAGIWLVGRLLGSGFTPGIVVVALCSLLGAGIWAQLLEASSGLSRPFGYYGSVLGGIFGVAVVQVWRGDGWLLLAAFFTAAPLIQATGRLRCLVQGCCHGRLCPDHLGIRYHHPLSRVCQLAHWSDRSVYPTPLYSILGNVVILGLQLRLWFSGADAGVVSGTYLILSAGARFMEEGYRGEPQTVRFGGLAIYQWLALLCTAGGAVCTVLPAPSAPLAGGGDMQPLLCAVPFGLLVWFAMGVDFPESNRRFSRLA